MTESGRRAATIVICDLILPENTASVRMANSFDASGVKEKAESIGRARDCSRSGLPMKLSRRPARRFESTHISLPFQGFGVGPSGEEVGRL